MSQLPKIRRAPNIPAFLLTGGVLGLVLGVLLAVMGHADSRYNLPAELAFFGLIGAAFGVLVGGIVAVLLDRKP
jgi:tetrahydromethanopterin S-methyltransferase subunit C